MCCVVCVVCVCICMGLFLLLIRVVNFDTVVSVFYGHVPLRVMSVVWLWGFAVAFYSLGCAYLSVLWCVSLVCVFLVGSACVAH